MRGIRRAWQAPLPQQHATNVFSSGSSKVGRDYFRPSEANSPHYYTKTGSTVRSTCLGPWLNPPPPADADDDRALDSEAQIPRPARAAIGGNAKVILFPITVLAVSIICTVLLSLYAFAAILSQHPQIGGWFLDASRTNFLIGIFSQIYGRLKVFLWLGCLPNAQLHRRNLLQIAGCSGGSITYWQIWGRVFIPHQNSSSFDNSSIASLIGSLTWLLRLEHDLYSSDKNTPVTYLQNFLAVPLQFTVSCIQYANYTSGDAAGTWAMPDEFKTQAIFGTSDNRIYGPPGPTISFIAVAVATDLIFAAMIFWMLVQGRPLRATPPINDLDLISLADEDQENGYPRLREIAQHTQDQEKGWWERLEPVRRLRLALLKRPGRDSIVVREPLDRRSEATPFLLQDFNDAAGAEAAATVTEGEASERTTDSNAPAAFTESSTAVSETGQQQPTNTAITKDGLVAPAGRAVSVPRDDRQRHSWAGAYTPLGHLRL
ncbi:hypothetical protein QBC46DRAFT_357414 [Diplogelasinospora grovesii]|uniref:Uncharacterized protein n=1 Tax=Diplogelasinospora grovesii TaxID=303347 RepID=A0AAN6S115_9PEZI|nr:hypothetical protein QBC46DRAFT_357414 [Diplogelasinospora grovesii]